MKEINSCEVCGNKHLRSVINLGMYPMCDDLVPINENRICREYPIDILFCDICLTAHQHYQVNKEELFADSYHYRARVTGSVLSGMSELVDSCNLKLGGIKDKVVLDIGCNDGSLLNFFKAKGCRTVGIEPTAAAYDSKHRTIKAFFNENTAKKVLEEVGQPDIITFTNVFAHIDNLNELIANLKLLIGNSTTIIIENHYLGAILEYGQFDTFYQEHPRTYSFRSFQYIAEALGLNLIDVQFVSRYGGNIRVYLGKNKLLKIAVEEKHFSQMFNEMRDSVFSWAEETKVKIEGLIKKHGKLRAKAFPGRASIMIKLLGLNEEHISAVYEIKGSVKVGHYVPGTRIPILPEEELFLKKDLSKPILNLAWHIPDEVRANLSKNGYIGDVIDIKKFERLK